MTEKGVLVIGEGIVDVLREADTEVRAAGGSPLNVAFGLARLGVRTQLLSRIGCDADGDLLRAHVLDAGVELLADSTSVDPTSTAIATIQSDGSAHYEFDITWSLPSHLEVAVPDWVHVGSIAAFLTPGADSVEELLRSMPGQVPISFDPNIRPALIADRGEAVARFERLASLARVVKLSVEDAEWLYPHLSGLEALKRIADLGPSVVGMTMGSAGARLLASETVVDIEPRSFGLVDTIGAGDSFMAALIHGLLDEPILTRERILSIGDRAATAAGITCSRAGAMPPTLGDLLAVELRTVRSRS
jgi:fructokinase